ncbi:MJ0042-type zinc finger domain-containing protein [Ehrlichia ruminantium]|uniref:MJ0042-type zinc finger domain-containing protein n=1 Tax=Ehrlichia ruminantium TaxID=779 RepID=UPI00080BBE5C|nr:MJ0042-type zinc finger domain-containing protein [Ehrlichia ruminantium]
MRIECKNCKAVYRIDNSKIPINGKKVKCTNCNTTWMHIPTQDKATPEEEEKQLVIGSTTNPNLQNSNAKASNNKSSKKQHSLLKKISSVLVMLILTFFLSATFQNSMPYNIRKIYRIIEMYDTTQMQLIDSHIQIIKNNGDNIAIKVEGIIKNESDQERFVPGIHFVLYNKNKKVIASERLNESREIILSNQQYKFEHIIYYAPKNTDSIQIKIGNIFEVAFL